MSEKQHQYEVTIREFYRASYLVAANSEEEAVSAAKERYYGDSLLKEAEFECVADESLWTVVDQGEDEGQ
jgi:hypothetical protein